MTFHIRTDINERTPPRELLSYIALLEQRVLVEQDVDEAQMESNLRRMFGLTPYETRFLLALSDGRVWPKSALLDRLYSGSADEPPASRIVDVWASRMRRKLAGYVRIDTEWGVGYRIPDVQPLKQAMRGDLPPKLAAHGAKEGRAPRSEMALGWLRGIAGADGRSSFAAHEFKAATGAPDAAMQLARMAQSGKLRILARGQPGGRGGWVVEVAS